MPNSQRRRKKLLRAFPDVKLPFSLPVTHIFWNLYDNKAKAMNKISHWPVFKHSSLSSENSTNLVILSSLLPQLMVLLKTVEGLPAKSTWRLGEESSSEHLSTEVSQQFIHPPIFGFFFFSTFLINCKLQQKSWKFLICFLAEERQIFPWGVTSPDNKPAPAWVSHSVTASFGHTPFPTRGSPGAASGSLLPCAPPWAAGRQLLQYGHTHGLQGNHRSSTCPSYTALGASRAAPLAYPHSSLCCCSAEVFFPILK